MRILESGLDVVSLSELKRQARSNNSLKPTYSFIAHYGEHLRVLTWLISSICLSIIGLLLVRNLSAWLFVPIAIILLMLLERTIVSVSGRVRLQVLGWSLPVARLLCRILSPLLFVINRLLGLIPDRSARQLVNSREELLEQLSSASDLRHSFNENELLIARSALTFADKAIGEIMTPLSVVQTVKPEDSLSTHLLSELYESGYSRFPVVENQSVVGMLYSKDLVDLKTARLIRDVMRQDVYYVNEFTALDQVLNAFLKTEHHLFIVVNEFEEMVGVVSIEVVLEQIIGRKIIDEFDRYDDLRLVARQRAEELSEERDTVTP